MKYLQELFLRHELKHKNNTKLWRANLCIQDLAYHSAGVAKDHLFFAVPGFTEQGNSYIKEALKKGACAAVVQSLRGIKKYQSHCLLVDDVRKSLALASTRFFGDPSKNLQVFAVTGTKGKTSTSYLLHSIFNQANAATALLSTVEKKFKKEIFPSERTTLESYEIQKFMKQVMQKGAKALVLEVSSHGLSLARVKGCNFNGMLFTNLSEDHLDFYKDMEDYYQAKKLLFTEYVKTSTKEPKLVINADDYYGQRLVDELKTPFFTYGLSEKADFTFKNLSLEGQKITGVIIGPENIKVRIESVLAGKHNCYNILGAVSLAALSGIPSDKIASGVSKLEFVPGRLQKIPHPLPFQVYVDFAHTGVALANVLSTLRPLCKNKLIVVLGAGGDRPLIRRMKMGEVAAELADVTIITSDNPRSEKPQKIVRDIEVAFTKKVAKHKWKAREYFTEVDRRRAIQKAIAIAEVGDIICLAGRGHQTVMHVGNENYHFSDCEEAEAALKERIRAQC